jgi:hypothetical protein
MVQCLLVVARMVQHLEMIAEVVLRWAMIALAL